MTTDDEARVLDGPRIRAVVYGVGAMGLQATRFAIEHGVDVVGAISRSPGKVGHDLGEIAGLPFELGVLVDDDPERVLSSTRPDVVLHATTSYLPGIRDQLALCLRSGANVITIAEEALHAWSTSPGIAAELDAIALENGVTLIGTGHQDVLWLSSVTQLMGVAHRIRAVRGAAQWNVDEFGVEVLRSRHVGQSLDEFEATTGTDAMPPSFGRNLLGALVAASGLSVLQQRTDVRPVLAGHPTRSRTLDRLLPSGTVIGLSEVDTVTTHEGIEFSFAMSGFVYRDGERDCNVWDVVGDPDLHLEVSATPTDTTTGTQFVNRIPDVIEARPGFVPVSELPPLRYRHLPFPHYVTSTLPREALQS